MDSLRFMKAVDVLVSTEKGSSSPKNKQFKVILDKLIVEVRIRMGRWVVMK